MRPNPDELLHSIADKIDGMAEQADGFARSDLLMLGLVLRAIAARYDEDADTLLREIAAMRTIFAYAVEEAPGDDVSEDELAAAMEDAPPDHRLSTLRQHADRQLKLIGRLHAAVELRSGSILRARIETFLHERTLLRSLAVTSYPTPELEPRKASLTLGGG